MLRRPHLPQALGAASIHAPKVARPQRLLQQEASRLGDAVLRQRRLAGCGGRRRNTDDAGGAGASRCLQPCGAGTRSKAATHGARQQPTSPPLRCQHQNSPAVRNSSARPPTSSKYCCHTGKITSRVSASTMGAAAARQAQPGRQEAAVVRLPSTAWGSRCYRSRWLPAGPCRPSGSLQQLAHPAAQGA